MSLARRLLATATTPLILAATVVVATLVGSALWEAEQVTVGLIQLTMVLALWVFVGNSGIVSFGHVGFVAIGAFATALLTIPVEAKTFLLPELPGALADASLGTIPALACAAAVCGVIALVVGALLMRLSGLGASIATFSFLVIVFTVLSNWSQLTGGSGTLSRIPTAVGTGQALVAALVVLAMAALYAASRAGRRLKASREDMVAAKAVGIDVARARLGAFVLSAMLMGVGGGVYALYLGSISPGFFYIELTFTLVAMLVIGGMTSLTGAVFGTLTITVISQVIQEMERSGAVRPGLSQTAVAVALLLILIKRPRGLTAGHEIGSRLARRLGAGARLRSAASPVAPQRAE